MNAEIFIYITRKPIEVVEVDTKRRAVAQWKADGNFATERA